MISYYYYWPKGSIPIPRPGDIRQGSLTGEKGGIVGGSRFFAGKGAWIRRVEGLEGGDGCNREKGIVFPFNMEKGIVSKCE
jgi:hypothetical protein